jgi:hypothetical protein
MRFTGTGRTDANKVPVSFDKCAIKQFEQRGFRKLRLQFKVKRFDSFDDGETRRGNAPTNTILVTLVDFQRSELCKEADRVGWFAGKPLIISEHRRQTQAAQMHLKQWVLFHYRLLSASKSSE